MEKVGIYDAKGGQQSKTPSQSRPKNKPRIWRPVWAAIAQGCSPIARLRGQGTDFDRSRQQLSKRKALLGLVPLATAHRG